MKCPLKFPDGVQCGLDIGHGDRCERAAPTFETAQFYTCEDYAERLYHTEPYTAVQERLEKMGEGEQEDGEAEASWLRRIIAREAPITVYAYVPVTVANGSFDNAIDCMMDNIECEWLEEYGDPDGEQDGPRLTSHDRTVIEGVLNRAWRRETPWACDRIAEKVYSVADLLALFSQDLAQPDQGEERYSSSASPHPRCKRPNCPEHEFPGSYECMACSGHRSDDLVREEAT